MTFRGSEPRLLTVASVCSPIYAEVLLTCISHLNVLFIVRFSHTMLYRDRSVLSLTIYLNNTLLDTTQCTQLSFGLVSTCQQ